MVAVRGNGDDDSSGGTRRSADETRARDDVERCCPASRSPVDRACCCSCLLVACAPAVTESSRSAVRQPPLAPLPRQSMAHKRPFPACASVCISLLTLGVSLSLCCWRAEVSAPTRHESARVQASGRSKGRRCSCRTHQIRLGYDCQSRAWWTGDCARGEGLEAATSEWGPI